MIQQRQISRLGPHELTIVTDGVSRIVGAATKIQMTKKFCAMINLYGHTSTIDVSISASKKNYSNDLYSFSIRLAPYGTETCDSFMEGFMKQTHLAIKNLDRYLQSKSIDRWVVKHSSAVINFKETFSTPEGATVYAAKVNREHGLSLEPEKEIYQTMVRL